jgi:hypothetical protein
MNFILRIPSLIILRVVCAWGLLIRPRDVVAAVMVRLISMKSCDVIVVSD